MELTNICLEVFAAIVVFFLMVGCMQFKQIFDYASNLFIQMQAWNLVMLLCDAVTWTLVLKMRHEGTNYVFALGAFECAIFIAFYMMMFTFIRYINSMVSAKAPSSVWVMRIGAVISALAAVSWCVSAFNGMFFRVSAGGVHRGPHYWWGQVGGYLLVLLILYLIFVYWKVLGKDAFFLLSFVVFPFAASLLRSKLGGLSVMDLALTLSSVLIYNFVHVGAARVAKEQEVVLGETQMKLMTSQIQPHFIFNSLNTIYYLVEKDPAMAQQAINTFSDYLRVNIDSLKSTKLQPFEKELEHVESYLKLEKMRFDDELEVNYDIQTREFLLPALSLQPIVENAVKHGVGKKPGGGHVNIRTWATDTKYVIEVEDDGVGFDMKHPRVSMEHSIGVGLENVRQRLKSSCNGRMEIDTEVGRGTRVQLILPIENDVCNIQLKDEKMCGWKRR